MEEKINVAIIGYGFSGKIFHAPFIHTNSRYNLKTIVSSKDEALVRYPYVNIEPDIHKTLADKTIDLVIVTSPNIYHYEHAKLCLFAKKHVIVEKPITNTSAEALELAAIAKEKNLVLSTFHNRRWDGDFLTVQKILKKKYLGEVLDYEVHFDRYIPDLPNNWRFKNLPGSGVLFDLGSHLIDQAIFLFGKPIGVWARIYTRRKNSNADDTFDLKLIYPEINVTLKGGVFVKEPGPRFTIHGTNGSFVKFGTDPQEEALKTGQWPEGEHWGEEDEKFWGILNTNHDIAPIKTTRGNYHGFFNNVYDSIMGKADLAVHPENSALIIEIIEKAIVSNKEGKIISI